MLDKIRELHLHINGIAPCIYVEANTKFTLIRKVSVSIINNCHAIYLINDRVIFVNVVQTSQPNIQLVNLKFRKYEGLLKGSAWYYTTMLLVPRWQLYVPL